MIWLFRLLRIFLKRQVKRRGILAYLKAVQASRRLLILAILGHMFVELMVLSAIGALVTGVWLIETSSHNKLEILFAGFLALLLIPLSLLMIGLSERFWYRLSGAQKLVNRFRD